HEVNLDVGLRGGLLPEIPPETADSRDASVLDDHVKTATPGGGQTSRRGEQPPHLSLGVLVRMHADAAFAAVARLQPLAEVFAARVLADDEDVGAGDGARLQASGFQQRLDRPDRRDLAEEVEAPAQVIDESAAPGSREDRPSGSEDVFAEGRDPAAQGTPAPPRGALAERTPRADPETAATRR